MEDLNDKITTGTLTASQWNQPMSEIQNVIEDTGQTLAAGDLDQLGKGIAHYVANGKFYTESGIVNAYVLTGIGAKQSPDGYTNGMEVMFIPGNTNTGASTVNVATLGVKNINLTANSGELPSGKVCILIYNGTTFDILSVEGEQVIDDHLTGYKIELGADTDHDLIFNIGSCADSANSYNLRLKAAFTKRIDATWAVGDAAGGLFSGASLTINSDYYMFSIRKTSDGSIDVGFDDNVSATNIPTGYVAFRLLGVTKTDGSSNIESFIYHISPTQMMWRFVTSSVATTANVTYSIKTGMTDGFFNGILTAYGSNSTDTQKWVGHLQMAETTLRSYMIKVQGAGIGSYDGGVVLTGIGGVAGTVQVIMHNAGTNSQAFNVNILISITR